MAALPSTDAPPGGSIPPGGSVPGEDLSIGGEVMTLGDSQSIIQPHCQNPGILPSMSAHCAHPESSTQNVEHNCFLFLFFSFLCHFNS